MSTVNNQISFVTNMRLLFVPLFGIGNFTGRVISFFARIIMLFFGMILMFFMIVAITVSPFVWFSIPYWIFKYLAPLFTTLYFIFLYVFWILINIDKPNKKVHEVSSENEKILAFRPDARRHVILGKNDCNLILKNILKEEKVTFLLKKSELESESVFNKFLNSPTIKVESVVKESFDRAKENKSRYVEIEHVFLSIIENIPNIEIVLATYNSSPSILRQCAFWIIEEKEKLSGIYMWQDDYRIPPAGGIGKGMLGRVTPNLDRVSVDITKEVKRGNVEKIVGRENEIKKISDILDGDKNDILIVGESGIGKTSIIRGIAYKIMTGIEYRTLKNKRIVSLDIASVISGGGGVGNVAEKLVTILEEVESSGDIILFIDEMQNLVTGMGEKGGYESTILSMLEGYISKKRIRVIGAVSMSNYRKYIEPNDAVARLFQIIKIEESSVEDTVLILEQISKNIEKQHGITITYPAILTSIKLTEKLIGDKVLPDKAIDLLQRTATTVKNFSGYLTSVEIEREISEMTSVPMTAIDQNEADKLLTISSEMRKKVIGQDQAIKKIEIALQRARTGMRDESKPIAGFLFVGMTGVGKTETAKALLNSYFGDSENMIRLDMSEYQQIDSISRIIGTPDGSTSGTLTEKVRNKPFSLILIDEIEKAHPNILQTFLQLLDEGRLSDTNGNLANFTNTIIVATSNVGTKSIQEISEKGGNYQEMQESTMIEIRNKFAPELLNRFTAIIVFNPLSIENLREITKIMLERVKGVAKEKGVEINFKPELIDELIKKGYSPEWGARPLARVIEDSVESYIAVKMLKKEINSGDRLMLGNEVFGI